MRNKLLALLGATCLMLAGCGGEAERAGAALTGGNPQRGREAIGRFGCGSCHTIGGISGARGLVGPPLTGIGSRIYVGGVLSNTPQNMIRWIRNPREVDEKTAMPVLGVNDRDATDIAAYLYSTR